jgi:hypothetical protein
VVVGRLVVGRGSGAVISTSTFVRSVGFENKLVGGVLDATAALLLLLLFSAGRKGFRDLLLRKRFKAFVPGVVFDTPPAPTPAPTPLCLPVVFALVRPVVIGVIVAVVALSLLLLSLAIPVPSFFSPPPPPSFSTARLFLLLLVLIPPICVFRARLRISAISLLKSWKFWTWVA